MAVLDKLEADVRVDGQPLLEYENNDPEEDSRPQTVVKYVEAPTDAAFAIHVRISKDYQMTSEGVIFMFEADGKGLTKKTVAQEELHGRASDKEVVVNGRRGRYESGALNRRPLRFTEINFEKVTSLIDSATTSSSCTKSSATSSLDELEDLGTLTVKVFEVENIRKSDEKSFGDTDTSLNPIKAIKEKLDAHRITLRVTFGAPQPHASSVGRVSNQVSDSPVAIFIFKYRTKESLLQLNVRRTGLNTQQEPIGELTVGELRAEQQVHQTSGTTTSRRSSGVSQQLQLISNSPQTPENQLYDSIRSRRRSSSNATATPTPARFTFSREPPEPVTPRSSFSVSPLEPVSRRGSRTPTTPSGRLFIEPRVANRMPTTPSTIVTIPEESPSEDTPRASGRKPTHSTSSPITTRGSTSNDSVMATSAASSEVDDASERHVRRPLRKGSVFWMPPLELRSSSSKTIAAASSAATGEDNAGISTSSEVEEDAEGREEKRRKVEDTDSDMADVDESGSGKVE